MQGPGVIRVAPAQNIEELIQEVIKHPEKQLVLEIPAGNPIFRSEINLRLLKFYIEEEEKDLVIRTKDPAIISLAARVGISTTGEWDNNGNEGYIPEVESEIAAAPEAPLIGGGALYEGSALRVGGTTHSLTHNRRFITAILIAIFTLCLAGWWFFQTQAVVTVYPKIQEITFTVLVKIGVLFTDQDIQNGKIPARILTKDSKIQVQTATSGTKFVGETPATGEVTFINDSEQPVVVPAGSILIGKAGVQFLTQKEVLVPKRNSRSRSGIVIAVFNGQANVGVVASAKGAIGNQPAGSINQLEEKYRRFLHVIQESPTAHGTDKKISIVTLEDVNKGEAEAREQMRLVGPEEAPALTGAGYLFFPELVQFEVLNVTHDPMIGNESDLVQTTLEYRTSVLAPAWAGINKFFAGYLDKEMPPRFKTANSRVALAGKRVIATGKEWAQVELTGKSQIKGVLDPAKIKALIKGKSLNQAKAILTAQDEVAGSKIQLRQGRGKLPLFGFQIKVVLH
ncbi:MAG: baseplate J/gp47 family protein [Firmicutes bacterium]|nr:baseplate J/gp47 family protein [Bacillota bacterium]